MRRPVREPIRWLLLVAVLWVGCEDTGRSGPSVLHDSRWGQVDGAAGEQGPGADLAAPDLAPREAGPDATPAKCGNGVAEGNEKCDGKDLRGKTCVALGYLKGTLSCMKDCLWDLSGCSNCGNGKLDPEESCDGANFGTWTCQKVGYYFGALTCDNCTVNPKTCHNCGNNKVDLIGEFCDGTDLQGKTCTSFGYKGGTLKCNKTCGWDASGCY